MHANRIVCSWRGDLMKEGSKVANPVLWFYIGAYEGEEELQSEKTMGDSRYGDPRYNEVL
jgi:hypothetical protein